MGATALTTIAEKKNIIVTMAAFRRFFLFIIKLVGTSCGAISSAVMSSTIAPIANWRLMSPNVNAGICVVYSSSI